MNWLRAMAWQLGCAVLAGAVLWLGWQNVALRIQVATVKATAADNARQVAECLNATTEAKLSAQVEWNTTARVIADMAAADRIAADLAAAEAMRKASAKLDDWSDYVRTNPVDDGCRWDAGRMRRINADRERAAGS